MRKALLDFEDYMQEELDQIRSLACEWHFSRMTIRPPLDTEKLGKLCNIVQALSAERKTLQQSLSVTTLHKIDEFC